MDGSPKGLRHMSTLQRFRVLTWYYGRGGTGRSDWGWEGLGGAGRGRRCGGTDKANYGHREKIGDNEGVA